MALPANNNSNGKTRTSSSNIRSSFAKFLVADSSSILLTDLHTPSTENLFDCTASDSTTVNKCNDNYHLTDADLAALFVSSITTDDQKNELSNNNNNNNNNNNTLDDVFIQQVNDLVCASQQKSFGPPPGFENFRFDTSSSSDNSTTISSISTAAIQTQVSSSDTINFSQLLQSTTVGKYSQTSSSSIGNLIL